MRSRIAWLVVATTTAVVISFVVPLCLLVRTLAHDRAMAGADQEARNVAILASNFEDAEQLRGLVEAADRRGTARVSLVLDEGTVLGAAPTGLADDPDVRRARGGDSAVVKDDRGGMVVLPVVVEDGTWVVVSRVTTDQLNDGVARAWVSFVVLGLVLIGLALLVANWLGRRISRPLVELSGTAHRLRSGDLSARADVSGPPEIHDLADRARSRKLSPDEIQGGTFTISNNGSAGSVLTMPIINQPQVAIVSTDAIVRKPVVAAMADGAEAIVVHPVGNLAMSWDHRAFDGAYAAGFLKKVKAILETRDWDAEL